MRVYAGIYRAAFSIWCDELMLEDNKLFIPMTAHDGAQRIPNPAATQDSELELLHFLGQLMGLAIRQTMPLALDLPQFVWERLVACRVSAVALERDYHVRIRYWGSVCVCVCVCVWTGCAGNQPTQNYVCACS